MYSIHVVIPLVRWLEEQIHDEQNRCPLPNHVFFEVMLFYFDGVGFKFLVAILGKLARQGKRHDSSVYELQ